MCVFENGGSASSVDARKQRFSKTITSLAEVFENRGSASSVYDVKSWTTCSSRRLVVSSFQLVDSTCRLVVSSLQLVVSSRHVVIASFVVTFQMKPGYYSVKSVSPKIKHCSFAGF